MISCLLCQENIHTVFWTGKKTTQNISFYSCPKCLLIFKDPQTFPNHHNERERYLLHRNDPLDPRYRNMLQHLLDPLQEKITPAMKGLDYGCGPTTAISQILKEKGFDCDFFDPIFFPQTKALDRQYDFVTCSEVVEHFHQPKEEFTRLFERVHENGWIAIMTQPPPTDFSSWHYHRDLTHVCFYGEKTLRWIAEKHVAAIQTYPYGVTLMQKLISS